MGVRAWMATGLVAAGLWAAPASAEVLVTLRDPDGNQAFFTPTHAWLNFDPYGVYGETKVTYPAGITTDFKLTDGEFSAAASKHVVPQDIPTTAPYYWTEQWVTFAGYALGFDTEAAKGRFVRITGFGDIYNNTMIILHWCLGGAFPLCNEDYSPGRGDIFGPPMEIRISTSVPEPASWAMMMLGLFGVGFAYRRNQAANS